MKSGVLTSISWENLEEFYQIYTDHCIHKRLGIKPFSLLNTKLFESFLPDLELVKAVQPNFLIFFAKKLPLNPHPKTKNFLLFSELAGLFIRC